MDTKEFKFYGVLFRELILSVLSIVAIAFISVALIFYLVFKFTGFSLIADVRPLFSVVITGAVTIVLFILFFLLFSKRIYAYTHIRVQGDNVQVTYKDKVWSFGLDDVNAFIFRGSFDTSNLIIKTKAEVIKLQFESISDKQSLYSGIEKESHAFEMDAFIEELKMIFNTHGFEYSDIHSGVNGIEVFDITYVKK